MGNGGNEMGGRKGNGRGAQGKRGDVKLEDYSRKKCSSVAINIVATKIINQVYRPV